MCVTTMVLLEGGGSTGGLEGMECPRKRKDGQFVIFLVAKLHYNLYPAVSTRLTIAASIK